MKSPDEIKKGLECCVRGNCTDCPYSRNCVAKNADALALIRQLQAENAEQAEIIQLLEAENEEYEQHADKCCYESQCNAELNKLEALCKRLRDENEQLEAERDAAVEDLEDYATLKCFACKYYEMQLTEAPCDECKIMGKGNRDMFEWRGAQKEE